MWTFAAGQELTGQRYRLFGRLKGIGERAGPQHVLESPSSPTLFIARSAAVALLMATASPERSPPTTTTEDISPNAASMSETLLEHLSYPTPSEPAAPVASSSTPAQTRPILRDRLYVGNLHPSVDE